MGPLPCPLPVLQSIVRSGRSNKSLDEGRATLRMRRPPPSAGQEELVQQRGGREKEEGRDIPSTGDCLSEAGRVACHRAASQGMQQTVLGGVRGSSEAQILLNRKESLF